MFFFQEGKAGWILLPTLLFLLGTLGCDAAGPDEEETPPPLSVTFYQRAESDTTQHQVGRFEVPWRPSAPIEQAVTIDDFSATKGFSIAVPKADLDSNIVVFAKFVDRQKKTVSATITSPGHASNIGFGDEVTHTGTLSIFMIEGIGSKARHPVRVSATSSQVKKEITLDPKQHTLPLRRVRHITFHGDLDVLPGATRTVIYLDGSAAKDSLAPPALDPLVLLHFRSRGLWRAGPVNMLAYNGLTWIMPGVLPEEIDVYMLMLGRNV